MPAVTFILSIANRSIKLLFGRVKN